MFAKYRPEVSLYTIIVMAVPLFLINIYGAIYIVFEKLPSLAFHCVQTKSKILLLNKVSYKTLIDFTYCL